MNQESIQKEPFKDSAFQQTSTFEILKDKKIGSGSFGTIYQCRDVSSGINLAIKIENLVIKNSKSTLEYESKILKYLQGGIGIPKFYSYFSSSHYNLMIFELLGQNLEDVFSSLCQKQFSLQTVIHLGEQMLNRIEFLHSKGFIHCDIKPENFVIGSGAKKNIIYLIDFGISKRYKNLKTKVHIPYQEGQTMKGTARYTSINSHLGVSLSRRDDLESLAYCLIYFYKGSLPWQYVKNNNENEKYQHLMEMKIEFERYSFFKELPDNLKKFLQYTKNLEFEETPDYRYLRKLLKGMSSEDTNSNEYVFDWSKN